MNSIKERIKVTRSSQIPSPGTRWYHIKLWRKKSKSVSKQTFHLCHKSEHLAVRNGKSTAVGKETKTYMVISSVMLIINKIYEEIQGLIQFLATTEVYKICREIILPSASTAFYHIFPKYKCINLYKMLHVVGSLLSSCTLVAIEHFSIFTGLVSACWRHKWSKSVFPSCSF